MLWIQYVNGSIQPPIILAPSQIYIRNTMALSQLWAMHDSEGLDGSPQNKLYRIYIYISWKMAGMDKQKPDGFVNVF